MLVQCWASVVDDGPILYQHWVNVSCLLDSVPVKTASHTVGQHSADIGSTSRVRWETLHQDVTTIADLRIF